MSNVEFLSLESSLAFLNGLLDISISLVVLGLVLEFAPRLWSRFFGGAPHHHIEKIGEVLVILGVAGELALHIRSGQVEDKIKAAQRDKIIILETKLAPRRLLKEQVDALAAAAKPFAGQQYALSVATGSEPMAFLCQLNLILQEYAGWRQHKHFGDIETGTSCVGNPTVGLNIASGIHVRFRPESAQGTKAAADALSKELNALAVEVHEAMDNTTITENDVILVMVGAKL